MVDPICSNMFEIFDNPGIVVLGFMFDLRFTELLSLYSVPQNIFLSFNFLINFLVSDLMSNRFPFVVGPNCDPFVNNDTWNLVRLGFDKLMILDCIFC